MINYNLLKATLRFFFLPPFKQNTNSYLTPKSPKINSFYMHNIRDRERKFSCAKNHADSDLEENHVHINFMNSGNMNNPNPMPDITMASVRCTVVHVRSRNKDTIQIFEVANSQTVPNQISKSNRKRMNCSSHLKHQIIFV